MLALLVKLCCSQSGKKIKQNCPSFPWCSLFWKKLFVSEFVSVSLPLRWMGQISELKCSWFLLSPLFVFLPLSTRPWKLFSAASRVSPAHCTSPTRSWQWVLVNSSAHRRRTWCYRCGCLICRRKTSFLDLSNVIAGKVNLRRRRAGGKTMFRLLSSPPSLRRLERLFFPSASPLRCLTFWSV